MPPTPDRPDAPTVGLIAALVAVGAWAAKALVIHLAGGPGQNGAEDPLFTLGLLAAVVAAVALGIAISQRRMSSGAAALVLGTGAGLLGFGVAGSLAARVVDAVRPAAGGWVWGELNLWFVAALLVVVAMVLRSRPPVAKPG